LATSLLDNFGYNLAAVKAATKKHEAIETDTYAHEERVTAVAVAKELLACSFKDGVMHADSIDYDPVDCLVWKIHSQRQE